MGDNTRGGSESGTAPLIATDEVTYSSDTADVQLTRPVHVTGSEGSKIVVDVTSADGVIVNGNVAHDAADSGNPAKIGGKAFDDDNIPAAVAPGDRVNAAYTLRGAAAVALVNPISGESILSLPVTIGATLAAEVQGNLPHDTADDGNPVKIGGKVSAATPTDVADGDRVDAWFDQRGALKVNLVDSAGNPADDEGGAVRAQVDSEIAHDGADAGNPIKIGGYASDAIPTAVSADGDRVNGWFTPNGALRVVLASADGGANLDDGALFVTSQGAQTVEGTAAHDDADAGNPVKIGGYASDSSLTPVTNGDRTDAWFSRFGAQRTQLADGAGNDLDDGNGNLSVHSQYFHDDVDGGGPLKIGGYASTASPAAVSADGDRVNAWFNRRGAQRIAISDDAGGVAFLNSADALAVGIYDDDGNAVQAEYHGGSILTGMAVTGTVAHDGADARTNPVKIGGHANSGTPADVADFDVTDAWFDLKGRLQVGDGGGSLTVDGTVTANLAAGTNNIGDVDVLSVPAPLSTTGGGTEATALRVTVANNSTGLLPVSLASVPSHAVTNAGTFATQNVSGGNTQGVVDETAATAVDAAAVGGGTPHDAVDSGNPLKIGGKASSGVPTPVADADRSNAWFDLYGRQVVASFDPETALPSGSTGLRDQLFAERMTVLSDSLADGIAGFWTQSVANGGTVTSSGGEGLLKTSTATNGSAQISSGNVPYYPGQVAWLNSAIRFGDTGTAGDIRRLGMFTVSGTTPQEGFYYELSGTTLNAVYVKAASATAVASGSWSEFAKAPFTLDTSYHSFEIRYTANTIWFYIDNVLRHKVSGTTSALTSSLTLPITVTNVKTSGATDITFAIRNIGNGRFGRPGGVVAETGLSAVEAMAMGGGTPHDAVDSGNPLKVGGYAKAAAPTDASADGDRVNAWFLRNGAQATVLTAAGALIGGDATNGIDVDVTRTTLPTLASTATVTSVNDTGSTTTLLSSGATRKGWRIQNESTQDLFVKYGTTASLTDYTVMIPAGGFYAENHYYGRVDGIWRADASGAARITELT